MGKLETSGVMRCFIALEVNQTVRQALVDTQRKLRKAGARVSWVPPENIHLSLAFLGDIFPGKVSVLASKLDDTAAAFHPFAITVAGVQSFGRRHRPRVIWAGVTNPPDTLLNLQSAVAQIAQSCEIHLDDRTYKPHLTLGRVRASNNLEALTAAMASAEDAVFGESSVQRVLIMQSRLLSHGAEYTMLHESALKGER